MYTDIMDRSGLYRLDFPDGKSYIGQTMKNFRTRLRGHRNASMEKDSALGRACLKHRHEFTMTPLVVCDNMMILDQLEIDAIKAFGTLTPAGLNTSPGGGGTRMYVRVCRVCEEEFKGQRTAKICSMRCHDASRQSKDQDCENCGRGFKSRNHVRYCGPICAAQGKRSRGSGSRGVIVDGEEYKSLTEASAALEMSVGAVWYRVNQPHYPDWNYGTF